MTRNRTDLGKVVGANLKRLIKDSTYRTQAEFAYAFGVDERTVRRWIGKGVEKLYIVDELANFFNIDRISLLSEREGAFSLGQNVPYLFLNCCVIIGAVH